MCKECVFARKGWSTVFVDNFVPYKNRELCLKKPVEVYFNFNKKCWSVRQDGLVVGHTEVIMLKNARFIVNESGRQKVLATKQKNVHAWVTGFVMPFGCYGTSGEEEKCLPAKVEYNPYVCGDFVCTNELKRNYKVKGAGGVALNKHGVWAAYLY